MHTLPAPQLVVEHVPDAALQALDVAAVDAHPGEQEHGTGEAQPIGQ